MPEDNGVQFNDKSDVLTMPWFEMRSTNATDIVTGPLLWVAIMHHKSRGLVLDSKGKPIGIKVDVQDPNGTGVPSIKICKLDVPRIPKKNFAKALVFSGFDPSDIISILTTLAKRIDLNFIDEDGCTPLHWAVVLANKITRNVEIVKALIQLGAKKDVKAGKKVEMTIYRTWNGANLEPIKVRIAKGQTPSDLIDPSTENYKELRSFFGFTTVEKLDIDSTTPVPRPLSDPSTLIETKSHSDDAILGGKRRNRRRKTNKVRRRRTLKNIGR
jgi:hypothetical protein